MRTKRKIISAFLVLALMLSMLVIPGVAVSAAETTATEGKAAFTPSATYNSLNAVTAKNELISNVAENEGSVHSLQNWDGNAIKYNEVTSGDNTYGVIESLAEKSNGNHYVLMQSGGKVPAGGHFVLELDVATDSTFIPTFNILIKYKVKIETETGTETVGVFAPETPNLSTIITDDSTGKWHHLTIVGDAASGEMYIFVDGTLKKTQAIANDKIDNIKSNGLSFDAVRFQTSGNKQMGVGSSIAFDNYSVRFCVAGSNDWSTIKSLSNTGLASSAAETSLPAIAKVNGTEYSSTAAVTAALDVSKTNEVQILRPFAGKIDLTADAKVETNGLTGSSFADKFSYGEGSKISNEAGSSVVTVRVPALSEKTLTNNDIAANIGNTKLGAASNLNGVMSPDHTGDSSIWTSLITTKAGKSFVVFDGTANAGTNTSAVTSSDSYFQTNDGTPVELKENNFIVLDLDFAFIYDANTLHNDNGARFYPLPQIDNGNKWGGTVFHFGDYITDLCSFHHITYIADLGSVSRAAYFYVDGVQVKSDAIWTNSVPVGTTSLNWAGFRMFHNMQDKIAVSNYKCTYLPGEAALASIVTNVNAKLTDSANASYYPPSDSNYDMPSYPNAINIDGTDYSFAAAADILENAAVDTRQVEILWAFPATLEVGCNAVIKTNGFDVKISAINGGTKTENATQQTVTVSVPFVSSLGSVNTNSSDAVGSNSGNLLANKNVIGLINNINNDSNLLAVNEFKDNYSSNKFFELKSNKTEKIASSGCPFINGIQLTRDKHTIIGVNSGYYVHDFDIAVMGDMLPVYYSSCNRNYAGAQFPFGTDIALSDYYTEEDVGTWVHFTVVGDMSTNKLYLYKNGTLTGFDGKAISQDENTEGYYVQGFKFNVYGDVAEGDHILFSNMSVRVFNTENAWGGIAAVSGQRSITTWSDYVAGNAGEKTPFLALVNNEAVYTEAELTAKLSATSSNAVNVELYRALFSEITIGTAAVINTNGISVSGKIKTAPFFNASTDGNTITVSPESRRYDVTVNIGDKSIVIEDVLHGSDINDAIKAEYTVGNNLVLIDKQGNAWTDWAFATTAGTTLDSIVTDTNRTFTIDANKVPDNKIVLVNGNTSEIKELSAFKDLVQGDGYTLVLTGDVAIKQNFGVTVRATIYMYGHTLNVVNEGTNDHTFHANKCSPSFIGGTIVDVQRIQNQFLFIAQNWYDVNVLFKDVRIVSNAANFIVARTAESITFENCYIDWNCTAGSGGNFMSIGERSEKAVTINVIDTTIVGRHASATDADGPSFFHSVASDEFLSDTHTINIKGSNINLGEYAGTPSLFGGAQAYTANIEDSTILAGKLVKENAKDKVTVNIKEGTKVVNTTVGSLGNATGLTIVKSGDILAPYVYTSMYATVKWANGVEEKWAIGTTPFNANYKSAKVRTLTEADANTVVDFTESATALADLGVKINYTLRADLQLNVYVPTASAANIKSIVIGGVAYAVDASETVTINNVEHYVLTYKIAASEGAGVFSVVINANDYTVAREMSVLEYAKAAYGQGNAQMDTLLCAMLNYVVEAHKYAAVYSDNFTAIQAFLTEKKYTAAAIIGTECSTDSISAFITGASIAVGDTLRFRFTLANGVTADQVNLSVAGAIETTKISGDGYVELELRACDMTKDITITVGDTSATYNLYTYCKYVVDDVAIAETSAGSAHALGYKAVLDKGYDYARANEILQNFKAANLAKALYAYAAAAAAAN